MSEPQFPTDPQTPAPESAGHSDSSSPESSSAGPRYAPPVPQTPPLQPSFGGQPAYSPPHPYAQPESKARGTGLAIASMAVGLAALLTVAVGAFLTQVGVLLGFVAGIVAIVLGIVALVKRQTPVPSLVGIGAAVVAIVAALVLTVLAVGTYLTAGAGSQSPDGPATPGQPSSPTVSWPANYASGGLIFTEDGSEVGVLPSDALPDNALPTPEVSGPAPARIHVYVDYRCPYCAMFEEANGGTIADIIASGSADVELTPLTFLDKASAGAKYSSRTAGALACIADTDPGSAWDAHTMMLSSEFQPAEGIAGPNDAELIAALDEATGGLGDEARTCIEERAFVPFAQALNDWVFANPVPDANDASLTVTGTPFVIVNGEPYPGDPADSAAFRAFLEEQGVEVG